LQPASITRRIAAFTLAAAVLAAAASAAPVPPAGPWRAAPAYVGLFAPPSARAAYEAWTTPTSIDAVLRALEGDPLLLHPPGAWQAQALIASDVFGDGGGYDRRRLARVYGATRARVARGPRGADGRVDESWLLVSPYPDPSLQRLEPGTLLIILRVPGL
jgi:hypothetical protein